MSEDVVMLPDQDRKLGDGVFYYIGTGDRPRAVPAIIVQLEEARSARVSLMLFDVEEHAPFRIEDVPFTGEKFGRAEHWSGRNDGVGFSPPRS